VRREATERFVRAALGGDIAELMEVLAPDVTAWTDAGGKRRRAGLRPVHGRDKVARLLTSGRGGPDHPVWHYRRVNGDDAAVLFDGDAPFAVLVLDLTPEGDRVRGIYVVANPDKLAHLPGAAA
jgi:RNA polymerase sigma-70 factor (ECF subfamily)